MRTRIELPDTHRALYRDGQYFLQERAGAGWRTIAGPFAKRGGAISKWRHSQYWSSYAPPREMKEVAS